MICIFDIYKTHSQTRSSTCVIRGPLCLCLRVCLPVSLFVCQFPSVCLVSFCRCAYLCVCVCVYLCVLFFGSCLCLYLYSICRNVSAVGCINCATSNITLLIGYESCKKTIKTKKLTAMQAWFSKSAHRVTADRFEKQTRNGNQNAALKNIS